MARIVIGTLEEARVVAPPVGMAGGAESRAYFAGAKDPIHLHLHRIERGGRLRIAPPSIDCLAFVWQGAVEAGGRLLDAGSSLIVEHGAALDLVGRDDDSVLLTFAAGRLPANQRAGGHVHLLPSDRVPRVEASARSATSGGLHSDGTCPTCELWLNENALPGWAATPAPAEAAKGVHAHAEDEVIFVIDGQIRLGTKLYEKGTALAIAADTLYGFTPGPPGLRFITFRAAKPSGIRFASGEKRGEGDYWAQAGSPPFLEPLSRAPAPQ